MSRLSPFHHLADLGEHKLHTPDFALVAQTVFTANTQFLVQTLALVGATGSAEGKTIYSMVRMQFDTRRRARLVGRESKRSLHSKTPHYVQFL